VFFIFLLYEISGHGTPCPYEAFRLCFFTLAFEFGGHGTACSAGILVSFFVSIQRTGCTHAPVNLPERFLYNPATAGHAISGC
jgi:hypothetical protein